MSKTGSKNFANILIIGGLLLSWIAMTALGIYFGCVYGSDYREQKQIVDAAASVAARTARPPIDLTGLTDPGVGFAAYHTPADANIAARAPAHKLPQRLQDVCNIGLLPRDMLSQQTRALLEQRGFAVIDYRREDDICTVYAKAESTGLPPLVTVDTVLQLCHQTFSSILADLEEIFLDRTQFDHS